jgi:hypothetical protein
MSDLLTNILKNLGCSYCQEYEFQENFTKENYKSWSLYLKEYELYSAMILYNNKLKKDISYLISKNESLFLLNDSNDIICKLEFISINEEDNNPILVVTDEYQEFYESIENMEKKYDEKLNASYIGTYNIKKCTKNDKNNKNN